MEWVLVFTLLIPLLPGVVVGLLVSLWARDERSRLLAELGVIALLALIAAFAWGAGYGVLAFFWMFLGAQAGAALVPHRRARRSDRVARWTSGSA
jgi:hypothetical protein